MVPMAYFGKNRTHDFRTSRCAVQRTHLHTEKESKMVPMKDNAEKETVSKERKKKRRHRQVVNLKRLRVTDGTH